MASLAVYFTLALDGTYFLRVLFLKGTVSRDGHFFEVLNILISTFCVCADGFQGLSKTFHCTVQLLTFLFASLKSN
jgi:hypothetical protein